MAMPACSVGLPSGAPANSGGFYRARLVTSAVGYAGDTSSAPGLWVAVCAWCVGARGSGTPARALSDI